ncbi:hypothetical protein DFR72_101117 [Lentzea flaviverrucosa]|uniref:Uncharacterized protein n=1 Tax=Lentzea flaviverrucosa TaxID=200379 RepID=A0A1H9XWK8_9PSEU|nr:hypothetical protein DFR72_101117 [Lentzea flaviverrucosa]SES50459.1 hypothetical protein SAMN05216195_12090 [Lentzea flaviverrucosa]
MERRKAALGPAAFFVLAPGGVAGLIPWLLTRWRTEEGSARPRPSRLLIVLWWAGSTDMSATPCTSLCCP